MFRFRPLFLALVINIFSWLAFLLVLALVYFAGLRDWQMNWGASAVDINRYMAGDELNENPHLNATRAVEIEAPPEKIWPWIVQMGYKRAGFYGFDKLDNGGFPSAERIMLEYQNLQVGDSIPGGEYRRGRYKGQVFHLLEVSEMEPDSLMLWVFVKGTPWQNATWCWGLYRIDKHRTKLVSRLRQTYSFETTQEKISWVLLDVMEIFMMRTTLLGIKRRVEGGQ